MGAAEKAVGNRYIPQILVNVRRGLTDNTATLVYPWEVPILEIVHGEGNVVQDETKESARWLKITEVNIPKDTILETVQGDKLKPAMAFDPSVDIQAEYMRMVGKYGMHAEVRMPNVEYVYGQFKTGQFEAAVLENLPEELREGREARILQENGAEGLNGAQVRAALHSRKIKFKQTASMSTLRALLNDALDEEREQLLSKRKGADGST